MAQKGRRRGREDRGQPNPRPLSLISFVMALRGPTEGVTGGIYEAISHSRLRNFLLRAIVQRGRMILFLFYLTWIFWKGTRHSLPQALAGRKGRKGDGGKGKGRREGTEEGCFTEAGEHRQGSRASML